MTYLEKRCAFNGRFVGWFLLLPNAVMVLVLVLGFLRHYWALAAPLLGIFSYVLIITWTMVYRNWPTGIRIDADGVRAGAVSSRRAERRTRRISAVHEAWGLFSCPWEAVVSISVAADAAELSRIRQANALVAPTNRWGRPADSGLRKGVLTAPFMRAALVVQVDLARATVPATYASRFYENGAGIKEHRDAGTDSAIWIVPTRRPQQLRQVIQQFPAFRSTAPLEAWTPGRKYHL